MLICKCVAIRYNKTISKNTRSQLKGENKMIKEMIKTINHAMNNHEMTIDCAKQLLKSISVLTGKEYSILASRVVYKDEIDGQLHDAWANA